MREILISKAEDKIVIMVAENGNIVEKYEEANNQKRLEGGIYLGKVADILPGMQAAFVDIGEKKNAFIHLKDLLPKVDSVKGEVQKKEDIRKIIRPRRSTFSSSY